MSFLVAAIGVVLLLVCLAGVALGIYMASDEKNREPGILFALCWVSGAAAAAGLVMRDVVTFLVGTLCFIVAGGVLLVFDGVQSGTDRRQRRGPEGTTPEGSEKTTKENRSGYKRAVS